MNQSEARFMAVYRAMLWYTAINIMYYVYILQSLKDKKLYIGYTTDLKRRIKEHKYGGSESTKKRLPFRLVFYEAFILEKDAKRREKYFKTTKGKRSLKLMLADSLKS
jgi:putative endonuclease